MYDARKFLSPAQRQRIEAAITQTEADTGIQIVCAVASESGRYDRAESLVGLCGSLLALAILHIVITADVSEGNWSIEHANLMWQSLAVVAGFIAGSIAASYIHTLRKLFTRRSEMEHETDVAASRVFLQHCHTRRPANGALLLYISLYERRLVVLADGAASAAAGGEIARELHDLVQRELRASRHDEAFLPALELLRQRLPNSTATSMSNSLPNTVAIYHPRP